METVDTGRRIAPIYVSPVTLTSANDDLPDPLEAKRELGLSLTKKYCLVQLGAGTINQIEDLREKVIGHIRQLGGNWEPVITRNPLTPGAVRTDATEISVYPVSKYFAAFEMAVLAAGYNSVQEAVRFSLPSVLVPNSATVTDDQVRRASEIDALGLGVKAMNAEEVLLAIDWMAVDEHRESVRRRLRGVERSDGAKESAAYLRTIL